MVGVADENLSWRFLLLEMAFNTKRPIPLGQHALVDRAVRRMANDATFPHSFVFENKGAALRSMALEACFILTQECNPSALERLLDICRAAFDRHSDMRIVTVRTTHLAF